MFTDPRAAAEMQTTNDRVARLVGPPLRRPPAVCLSEMVDALGVDPGTLSAAAQRTLAWLTESDCVDGVIDLLRAARGADR